MMSRIERDEEREERIRNEAIVDAYDAEEQIMGWYYYLVDSITFPFQARCILEIRRSPLRLNEVVKAVDLISSDNSHEILAEIEFMERTMGVPLFQLDPIDADEQTRQVVKDWHYWIARDYQFG